MKRRWKIHTITFHGPFEGWMVPAIADYFDRMAGQHAVEMLMPYVPSLEIEVESPSDEALEALRADLDRRRLSFGIREGYSR